MLQLLFGVICLLLQTISFTGAVHGGVILAVAGKDSISLSVDSRFSSAQTGALLLGRISLTSCKEKGDIPFTFCFPRRTTTRSVPGG